MEKKEKNSLAGNNLSFFISFKVCVLLLCGGVLSAPLESDKNREKENPLKLLPVPKQELPKIDSGLNRPSPINPDIVSEPRPVDRILETKVTKEDLEHHGHKRQVLADTEPGVSIPIKKPGDLIDLNKKQATVLPVQVEDAKEKGAHTPLYKHKENVNQKEHVAHKRSAQVLADTEPGVPISIKKPGEKIDLNKKPTESPVLEKETKGAFTPHLIHKEPAPLHNVHKDDVNRHDTHKNSKRNVNHEEAKIDKAPEAHGDTSKVSLKASHPQLLPFGSDRRPLLSFGHRQHNQDPDHRHEGPFAAILPFGHRHDDSHKVHDDKVSQYSEPSKRPARHTDNAPGKDVTHEAPKQHQDLPVEHKPTVVATHHIHNVPHAQSTAKENSDSHHQNQSPSKSHSQPSIKEVTHHETQKVANDKQSDIKKSDQIDANHSPAFVHPVPVSQIIKNSDAAPITHA